MSATFSVPGGRSPVAIRHSQGLGRIREDAYFDARALGAIVCAAVFAPWVMTPWLVSEPIKKDRPRNGSKRYGWPAALPMPGWGQAIAPQQAG